MDFPGGSVVKSLLPTQETQVRFLGQGDPLEKEMVTYASILAWEIPWTEEPGVGLAGGPQGPHINVISNDSDLQTSCRMELPVSY